MITQKKIDHLRKCLKNAQDYIPLCAYSYGEKCYGYALCTAVLDEKYDKNGECQLTSGWLDWRDKEKDPEAWDSPRKREDNNGRFCTILDTVADCEQQFGYNVFNLVVEAVNSLPDLLNKIEELQQLIKDLIKKLPHERHDLSAGWCSGCGAVHWPGRQLCKQDCVLQKTIKLIEKW